MTLAGISETYTTVNQRKPEKYSLLRHKRLNKANKSIYAFKRMRRSVLVGLKK